MFADFCVYIRRMERIEKPPKTRSQLTAQLRVARQSMDAAQNRRVRAAMEAREGGMTHQAIGDVLGVVESRVRQILKQVAK